MGLDREPVVSFLASGVSSSIADFRESFKSWLEAAALIRGGRLVTETQGATQRPLQPSTVVDTQLSWNCVSGDLERPVVVPACRYFAACLTQATFRHPELCCRASRSVRQERVLALFAICTTVIGAVTIIMSLLIIGDFSGSPNALNVILLILGFKTPFYLSLTQIQRLGVLPKITYRGIMRDLGVSKVHEQIIYVNFSSWY